MDIKIIQWIIIPTLCSIRGDVFFNEEGKQCNTIQSIDGLVILEHLTE